MYKKYECLKCGNVFPTKAKGTVYCRNGIKGGCRSTIVRCLEEVEEPTKKAEIVEKPTINEEITEEEPQEVQEERGFFSF